MIVISNFQELQNDIGLSGYKYIKVEEPQAANVMFCNGSLVMLDSDMIPKGNVVSGVMSKCSPSISTSHHTYLHYHINIMIIFAIN